MPGPIEREQIRKKLDTDVEKIPATSLDVAALRTTAKEVLGEYGESALFTDAAMQAELEAVLMYSNQEGLKIEDLKAALTEVMRHVSIQSHFDAQQAHDAERKKAGWNPLKHIGLNWKEFKTTFGGGVAADTKQKQAENFAKPAEIKALLTSATEIGVMRHRLSRYEMLGGPDLRSAITAFLNGDAHLTDLMDVHTTEGKHYDSGLNKIIESLGLKVGENCTIDGLGDVAIDTEEMKSAIEHHLKFVLRTEIVKLAEANQLTVLSSSEYDVTHPTAKQKLGKIATTVFSSGTFWGMNTRLATRAAFGGLVGIGAVTGGWALGVGIVGGMAAGAAGAYARERLNAADRLKRRRLEAALGAVGTHEVKAASKINAELSQTAKALQLATDEATTITALKNAFKVAADAQTRLRFARTAKDKFRQDFISFGVENRFQAQKELLDNIERSLAVIQQKMDTLSTAKKLALRAELKVIDTAATTHLKEDRKSLNREFQHDESRRRTRAAIIGGVAGGLGSLVSHYALELWGTKPEVPTGTAAMQPQPAVEVPVVSTATPDQLVNIPGAEPLTTAGKMSFIHTSTDGRYVLSLTPDHHLNVAQLADGGADIESTTSAVLPNNADQMQVVQSDHLAKIFDGQGKAVAEVQFTDAGQGGGGMTEQFFNNPDTAKMLDAMGLQKGELQYDPNTKLFHIPDGALRDAAGKAEYLGRTEGWRARRMEFILKAMAEGKANESPEMIVARAERATSNLLLTKGALHNNPDAAFNEAFSKDAGFIQKNVMPWVDGTRSRISSRWMRVVAEMKEHPVNPNGGQTEVTIKLLNPDGTAVAPAAPTDPLHSTIEAATSAASAEQAAAQAAGMVVDVDSANIAPLMASILGSSTAEIFAYSAGPHKNVAHAPERRNEFVGDDDHTVPETQLKDLGAVATELKTKALEGSKPERERQALAEIKKAVVDADAAIAGDIAALKPTIDAINSGASVDVAMIDTLIAQVAAVGKIATEVGKAKAVLGKTEPDFTFVQIDHDQNSDALANWVAQHEGFVNVETNVKTAVEQMLQGVAAEITEMRKKPDDEVPPDGRKQQLETVLLPKLDLVDKVKGLVPAIITDAAWPATLEVQRDAAKAEVADAILMIDFTELFGSNAALKSEVFGHLKTAGVIDDSDLSLPVVGKGELIKKLLDEVGAKSYTKDKPGLISMGFMKVSMTKPVGDEQKKRIKEVLGRLVAGESDIFRT